mmetsp:Transcript_44995/g.73323  ORF Transcript_44995/g.73323 Transcript_44995/m.73323 type:complete len:84 (+) Transcript_44995:1490-1741(+)
MQQELWCLWRRARSPANSHTTMYMGGLGQGLSNYLLTFGMGVWLGTSGVCVIMSCTSLSISSCTSCNFAISDKSAAHLVVLGS